MQMFRKFIAKIPTEIRAFIVSGIAVAGCAALASSIESYGTHNDAAIGFCLWLAFCVGYVFGDLLGVDEPAKKSESEEP